MSEETPNTETPPTPPAPPTPPPAETDELVTARLDAACVRGGLLDDHGDVARALLKPWLAEKKLGPSPENIGKFVAELRTSKPALFQPPPANTAPRSGVAPAAPAAGRLESAESTWRALREAGRTAEAEAFYKRNRSAILRGQ